LRAPNRNAPTYPNYGTYVDFDVDIEQVLDGVLQQLLLRSVTLESNSQETVLLAPVTEVVHADSIVAVGIQNVADKGSNDGTTQVSGVEGLGNVGRTELNNNLLVLAQVVASPALLGVVNLFEQALGELDVVEEEVDERSIGLGLEDVVVELELFFQLREEKVGC